jgi:hypothetical protein
MSPVRVAVLAPVVFGVSVPMLLVLLLTLLRTRLVRLLTLLRMPLATP